LGLRISFTWPGQGSSAFALHPLGPMAGQVFRTLQLGGI